MTSPSDFCFQPGVWMCAWILVAAWGKLHGAGVLPFVVLYSRCGFPPEPLCTAARRPHSVDIIMPRRCSETLSWSCNCGMTVSLARTWFPHVWLSWPLSDQIRQARTLSEKNRPIYSASLISKRRMSGVDPSKIGSIILWTCFFKKVTLVRIFLKITFRLA